jgi:hypothetical protein
MFVSVHVTTMLKKYSLITLVVLMSAIAVFRLNRVQENEISWDVLGYYLYLPAQFVHHDAQLNDITWIKQVNKDRHLTGTLYQVTLSPEGKPMYFFLMGMSYFYSPFFLSAHAMASPMGYAADGFSAPYQWALVFGGLLYTLIGLWYFRKILLHFFDERIAAIVLFVIVVGTNYAHHLTIDNLAPINVLFMLSCLVVWNTIQWHEKGSQKHLFAVVLFAALMGLVKPSEILIVIFPVVYGLNDFSKGLTLKLNLLWEGKWIFLAAILLVIGLAAPQLIYWHNLTGHYFFDSYQNPGIGLDLKEPHIIDVLISYRKGWLLYTPVMIFALVGGFRLRKAFPQFYSGAVLWFVVAFYIIASWSEWWYGAAFSIRPMITLYPILGVGLGYFVYQFLQKKSWVKFAFLTLILGLVSLNQFQWWQLRNWILDPYAMTREYYWVTFLKTHVPEKANDFLLVKRDFSGKMEFTPDYRYQARSYNNWNCEDSTLVGSTVDASGNRYVSFTTEDDFVEILNTSFNRLSLGDHFWVKSKLRFRMDSTFDGQLPIIVVTMTRPDGKGYGYSTFELEPTNSHGDWSEMEFTYLTPAIRDVEDDFKIYFWNRALKPFDVDDVQVNIYTRKEKYDYH